MTQTLGERESGRVRGERVRRRGERVRGEGEEEEGKSDGGRVMRKWERAKKSREK